MTWQPIKTAPKDGTKVLVFRDVWPAAYVAHWGINSGNVFGWLFDDSQFCVGHEDCFLGYDDDPMPTHWIDIPPSTQ